jgi:hypothetical protein
LGPRHPSLDPLGTTKAEASPRFLGDASVKIDSGSCAQPSMARRLGTSGDVAHRPHGVCAYAAILRPADQVLETLSACMPFWPWVAS